LKRSIITTGDGSKTIHIEDWDEQYHSKHGAVNEAYHVFIDKGLSRINNTSVAILEIGFGTGLNALITAMEGKRRQLDIYYTAVEAFPITADELEQLQYTEKLNAPLFQEIFNEMHTCSWEENVLISPKFTIHKQCKDFLDIADTDAYDLVYFDAFGARVQPELWTETIFLKMFKALKTHGILVTYAAKGSVRRAMQAVGFKVERLPGPPGKREMLRATKPSN